ncbi:MAG: SDR family NAD(P)-dependent oxidoreductase [Acidimicrobiia bacterium]|nr:SDR family NAD(P)-dependent oxidoreductase [Acidimicrobiia bacterium]
MEAPGSLILVWGESRRWDHDAGGTGRARHRWGAGIGAAICERLGADGVVVGVNYRRDADAAAATVERVRAGGGDAIAVQGDVGDPEALDAVVRTVRAELGPVTLLVNNAGCMRYLPRSRWTSSAGGGSSGPTSRRRSWRPGR